MEDRLIEALENSSYIQETDISKPRLLVYLMGPYKSHPPYNSPHPDHGAATSRVTLDTALENLQTSDENFDVDEALWLLIEIKRKLRKERGINAFLATDPEISLHEMDAATQSIEYTKASVATIFIAPAMGDNLGVGIEIGSVCEHIPSQELLEEVLFLGERNVESSMIDAVSDRWHVTVDDFEEFDELYQAVKAHIRSVA
ncbi:DUF7509 family protein [Haloarcula nitratireducens]|uniref:DUF7509 domain-containing protein n=1 Tax=Haloarcula nitratireducens TaxID=2487749 RepID=A0AAW4PH49_9EURY|nr:hypothetical protein [Halomicroarcula nitratireducens]MBX0297786.1 hypothetical protein [Halomicroarcula nitratireducens]